MTCPVATLSAAKSVLVPCPLVFVCKASQGAAVGHFEPALRAFQRLNARLLVKAQDDGVLRRGQIESDHVGRLFGKLRVGGDAPTTPSFQADAELAQDSPDPIRADRQRLGQERPVPARMPRRRRRVELLEESGAELSFVEHRRSARAIIVMEPVESLPFKARSPFADHGFPDPQLPRDLVGSHPFRRPEDDAGAVGIARLRLGSAQHGGQLLSLIASKDNLRGGTRHPPENRYAVNFCK